METNIGRTVVSQVNAMTDIAELQFHVAKHTGKKFTKETVPLIGSD